MNVPKKKKRLTNLYMKMATATVISINNKWADIKAEEEIEKKVEEEIKKEIEVHSEAETEELEEESKK